MKIAVLSRNPKLYSTKRLIEAIEARGHEAIIIDHLKCIIELEKRTPKIFYNGEYVENIEYATESTSSLVNKTFHFKVHVDGDTLTQKGIDNPYNEVWKRVKSEDR